MWAANNVQTTVMLFFFTLLLAFGNCNADSSSTGDGEEEFLIVHVTYDEIYKVLVFLIAIFVTGLLAQRMGMPSLVGEIFIGFLLGPPLANFVPYEKALVLIGEIGLIALILQAGIELDVAQLRTTGTRAMAIALTGSVLPVGCGFGIAKAFGYSFKAALAIGASFAPTSSGVVASVLGGGGMLNTSVGQLIIAACVVDDIVGLLLLSMFQVLVKEDAQLMEYFFPLISSFGFLLLLGIPAVTFLPRLIQTKFLPKFPESSRSLALFGLLTAMLMAYLPLMSYTKSSYLTGAFLAGATFSQIDGAYDKFQKHTNSIMEWLLRVFFAATIGFQVPLKEFSSPKVILLGLLLWVTCVAIKFPVALYVPRFEIVEKDTIYNSYKRDKLVTGIAMTCRGEFSFVIAAFALSQGVIALDTYASIVFAVLLSAISSPFLLLQCIKYFNVKEEECLAETNPMKKTGNGTMALRYLIKLETKNAWSLLDRIQQEVIDLDLVIEDIFTSHARGVDPVIRTEVHARDKRKIIAVSTMKKEQKMQEERETSIRLSLYDKLRDLSVTELSVKQYDPWNWAAALERMVQHKLGNDQVASEKFFYSIFEKADIGNSGYVNGDELFSVLTEVGIDITREGINAMIEHIDIEGDGRISHSEWEQYVDKYFDTKNGVKKSNLRDLDSTFHTDTDDFGYPHDEERSDFSFPISFSRESKSQSCNSLESIFEAADEDV